MKSETPFFSIITVCYNAQKTISKTLDSLLNQSFENFEYIVIDGASQDGTLSIIRSFEPLFHGRLRVVSEPDAGIYDAMNKGIAIARGQYVGLVNSDDWYENNTLEIIWNNVSSGHGKYDIFYGIQNFYKNDQFYKAECVHHSFLNEAPLYHATCFISKKTYIRLGSYALDYKLASDYEYFFRCRSNDCTFSYVPKVLANFSLDGATTQRKIQSMLETYQIKHLYGILSSFTYYSLIFRLILNGVINHLRNKFDRIIGKKR